VHHPQVCGRFFNCSNSARTTGRRQRHITSLVADGELIHIRGHRFGLPRRWTCTPAGCRRIRPGYGFVNSDPPLEGGGDIYIAGTNFNEAGTATVWSRAIERIRTAAAPKGRIIRILERSSRSIIGR